MKIIKSILLLVFSLIWIVATTYKSTPLNNLGSLLTYKPGLLSIQKGEEISLATGDSRNLVIKIDSFGIPYIYSNEDENVAFGLGFMHAKDRYFQMELMSKMVKGELAGMFGPRAIPSDEFWKPFEFDRKSAEILEEYKTSAPALHTYLLNYSQGVNAYLDNQTINDPLYTLFDTQPQAWKPEYCLLVTWYMSKNLAYFDFHSERQELIDKLPEALLEVLYPMSPDGIKTILPAELQAEVVSVDETLEELSLNVPRNEEVHSNSRLNSPGTLNVYGNTTHHPDIGSNNWAVNSKKTKGGVALVANDPHLFITLPGPFYETCLMGKIIKAYGYTIPGVPLIVSGHNTVIAWGITNGEWDLTDRYVLETKEDSLYLYQGEWIPFEENEYTIEVRGQGEEQLTVRRTAHGIVKNEEGQYYAQKWYPSNKSYSVKALFELMLSEDWNTFRQALRGYDYPPQNFIYADVDDNIGIVCAGKLPNRPTEFQGGLLDGTKAPLEEAFVATQWETSNPAHRYLFSANQLPVQNGQYFGMHWHKDDYRVNHIDSLLKAKNDWTIQAMKKMQLDEVDISFFHLQKIFQGRSFDKKYDSIVQLISEWDGNMNAKSPSAFIYEVLRTSIEKEAERFAKEELNVQEPPSMKSFLNYLSRDSLIERGSILENILMRTDSIISVEEEGMPKTYSQKSEFFAYNLSFLPGFGYKVLDVGGNKNTINMNAKAHPVFRSIYEMKKGDITGYTIMAGGQSGKMNAKNYIDQMEDWRKGTYKSTQFYEDPEELKNIVTTLNFHLR